MTKRDEIRIGLMMGNCMIMLFLMVVNKTKFNIVITDNVYFIAYTVFIAITALITVYNLITHNAKVIIYTDNDVKYTAHSIFLIAVTCISILISFTKTGTIKQISELVYVTLSLYLSSSLLRNIHKHNLQEKMNK